MKQVEAVEVEAVTIEEREQEAHDAVAAEQVENAPVVTNAPTLNYSKKDKAFVGLVKGSGSRKLYDIAIKNSKGILMAFLVELGTGETHVIPMAQVIKGGTMTEHGKKRPNYSGQAGSAKIALWKSEYTPTVFIIYTDIDEAAMEEVNEMFAEVSDDEALEQAETFFDTTNGVEGRPDTSEAADKEALAASKELNDDK